MILINNNSDIISSLHGKLIVSCQDYVEVMVNAAINGGASGLRINSPKDIRYARSKTNLPIIGCNKIYFPNSPIYITPTIRAATKLVDAGANMVAIDCTNRKRVRQNPKEIIDAVHQKGALAVADLSSINEAEISIDAGADILATTLSPKYDEIFIQDLVSFGKPILVEGHIQSPEQCTKAFEYGAWAVCVGTAITRPHILTMMFTNSVNQK